MKLKLLAPLAAAAILLGACSQTAPMPDITPVPASVKTGHGSFNLPAEATASFDVKSADELNALVSQCATVLDSIASPAADYADATIRFEQVDTIAGLTSPEGYVIDVTSKNITVKATTGAGLYYGMQTIAQMFRDSRSVPVMTITDEPRLPYRGMMLDVSRHFRDKEFVKKQMDAMAALKLNRLHLHLTDAAGWRLQIDKYPRLTQYAAWRKGETWKDWNENGHQYCEEGTEGATGGYFTKDDIRELLDYADERFITIIPEIEMPGHSEELTAAYPEISCLPHGRGDVCPGNEKTFEMLEGILDEVIELFPSEYIHIGGDEAGKGKWHNCPLCQKRMKEEGLENVDELQSYLIERIEKYLNSKGRNLLGWDEIMEGGLAPNATVMSWRGTEAGIRAAMDGHKVVMTPGGYCYLDAYQDAPHSQPEAIGGYLTLERVYSYNPVPDTIPAELQKNFYGLQGNLWCEYIPTDEHAEYMLYPRLIAIAETAWTPDSLKSWPDFRRRAENLTDRMRAQGYNAFDLRNEIGNRKEALEPIEHLAKGKPVTYNAAWWSNYTAGGDTTLTDGIRGGWNYSDQRWQGFLARKDFAFDVVIDLGEMTDITYIGADFMQICGPGVYMPDNVVISVSDDGDAYRTLAELPHEVVEDGDVTFKTFAWEGNDKCRYVRYQAHAIKGVLFIDEVVVK